MSQNINSLPRANTISRRFLPSRGLLFGVLILGALVAFEIFNYSTTDFALTDLMGDLRFADIRWATILAIAFCGIDFAGIARLFTPERGTGEPKEVWYLFGAWLLAATMNATLTWWGVAIAILGHDSLGGAVLSRGMILKVVPIFVAVMVWVIRVLIIGSFSMAGDRLFSQSDQPRAIQSPVRAGISPSVSPSNAGITVSPAYKPTPNVAQTSHARSETSYHPVSMSASNQGSNQVRK